MLRVWNLSLLCATFALTILGTFLTRSGVIDSVHAFSESAIGPAAPGLLRGDRGGDGGPGRLAGRPAAVPGAHRLTGVTRGCVPTQQHRVRRLRLRGAVGHRVPADLRGAVAERVTVGEPYFERMTMPIGLVLLFLMAVAPVLPWRKASAETLQTRLLWPGWFGTGALLAGGGRGGPGLSPRCWRSSWPDSPAVLSPPPARAGHPASRVAGPDRAQPTAG
jgi:cytochrome c-type biogenesis protein CcmF